MLPDEQHARRARRLSQSTCRTIRRHANTNLKVYCLAGVMGVG